MLPDDATHSAEDPAARPDVDARDTPGDAAHASDAADAPSATPHDTACERKLGAEHAADASTGAAAGALDTGDADVDPHADGAAATEEPLDPGWVPAELVSYRIFFAPLALGAGLSVAWLGDFDLAPVLVALGGAPLLYWILQRLARALVERQFAATRWSVDDAHLRIRRGVWWRKEIHVPRSRIQHTDVTQGPLQRHYGVATFVVHTAGTTYATVSLEGLAHARAQALRDRLVVGDGDDGV